ncbi:MAG: DNA-processing protein DprA [Gemmatimonadetes bacterium]|nr:DNA-processing protein DprA [Gemmatimonadota bacterium]
MPNEILDWLTLHSVSGLGPAAFSALLQKFCSPGEILRAPRERLCTVPGIGPELADAIHADRDLSWAEEQLRRAEDARVHLLTLQCPDYPVYLRETHAPPPILYVLGKIDVCAHPTVAIVGSRSFTSYGREIAHQMSGELVRRGITVVSGLATGIDTHVHQAALAERGYTVAVLGSGLDRPYPPQNRDLFRDISETGATLSEFPMGASAEAHNFPRRNRIISGLSVGVLVVEAGERSGALITARLALDQNREVFAIPGPVHSGRSRGTNNLIRQGAVLVQSVEDIVDELRPQLTRISPPKTRRKPAEETPELSTQERQIYECLSTDMPAHVDTIADHTDMPAAGVLSVLLSLELAGVAEQRPGKCFVRKPVRTG